MLTSPLKLKVVNDRPTWVWKVGSWKRVEGWIGAWGVERVRGRALKRLMCDRDTKAEDDGWRYGVLPNTEWRSWRPIMGPKHKIDIGDRYWRSILEVHFQTPSGEAMMMSGSRWNSGSGYVWFECGGPALDVRFECGGRLWMCPVRVWKSGSGCSTVDMLTFPPQTQGGMEINLSLETTPWKSIFFFWGEKK